MVLRKKAERIPMKKNIIIPNDTAKTALFNFFNYAIYIFAFLFWLWISSQAPYTNDDWDWGLPVGMEQLLTASVNSRYSGNLIIVCITRSRLFKTLFCGCLSWGLPFLISRMNPQVDKKDKLLLFVFANLIILTMNKIICCQTYGCLSAYANYITSGFCMVVIYVIIKRTFADTGSAFSKKKALFIVFFTIFSMLFIENLTIYFFGVAVAAFIMALVRKKNVGYMGAMLAAALVAVPIMFSSPSYASLFNDGYSVGRSISFSAGSSLKDILKSALTMFDFFLPGMYEVNAVICALFLAAVSGMLWMLVNKGRLFKTVLTLCNVTVGFLMLLNYFGFYIPRFLLRADGNTYLSLIFLILASVNMLYLMLCSKDKIFAYNQSFLWVSTVLVILPLLVTGNSGGRLYFSGILLMLIFLTEFYCYAVKEKPISSRNYNILILCMLIPLLVTSAYTANIYRVVGKIDREQRKIIAQAVENGDKQIYLPAYSPLHEEYVFCPMAEGEYRLNFFKQFYNIDQDVEIIYCFE